MTVYTLNKTSLLSKNNARGSEALRKLSYKQIWHLPLSSGRGRLLATLKIGKRGLGKIERENQGNPFTIPPNTSEQQRK